YCSSLAMCCLQYSLVVVLYTLSLHDALPIWLRQFQPRPDVRASRTEPGDGGGRPGACVRVVARARIALPAHPRAEHPLRGAAAGDRKSTRLNSSHVKISYAVFCLKKKNLHAS